MEVATIAEQLFFVTVYLEGRNSTHSWTGTGFVYAVETDRGSAHFLVTNKHVFRHAEQLTVRMVLGGNDGKPVLGRATQITISDLNDSTWLGHPDSDVDVAAMPFYQVLKAMDDRGAPAFFRSISPDLTLTPESLDEFDAIDGGHEILTNGGQETDHWRPSKLTTPRSNK